MQRHRGGSLGVKGVTRPPLILTQLLRVGFRELGGNQGIVRTLTLNELLIRTILRFVSFLRTLERWPVQVAVSHASLSVQGLRVTDPTVASTPRPLTVQKEKRAADCIYTDPDVSTKMTNFDVARKREGCFW